MSTTPEPTKTIIHVLPVDGRRVVDPDTRKPLPHEGRVLDALAPEVTHWRRREADGEVRFVTPEELDI